MHAVVGPLIAVGVVAIVTSVAYLWNVYRWKVSELPWWLKW